MQFKEIKIQFGTIGNYDLLVKPISYEGDADFNKYFAITCVVQTTNLPNSMTRKNTKMMTAIQFIRSVEIAVYYKTKRRAITNAHSQIMCINF